MDVKANDKISVTREEYLADWKSINLTSTGTLSEPETISSSGGYLNIMFDHHRSP